MFKVSNNISDKPTVGRRPSTIVSFSAALQAGSRAGGRGRHRGLFSNGED